MTSIHEILKELRMAALDERDKGSLFEKLTKTWLEVSPEYSNVFDKVWLYADWAAENGIPKTDVGIDLVARDVETQEICGIQCKFYAENHTVQKKDIDSFFTALSRKHFSFGIIVSTSKNWSSLAEAALEELTKPVVRIGLHDLENSGVDWSKFSLKNVEKLEVAPKKVPYEHQRSAISDALNHFADNDRGKLIMACGTGKTFTSLRLAEQMVPESGTMLFLVPSIALLSQSLKEWKQEAEHGITAYAVCSDVKVGKSKSDEDIQVTDLAYPATTDAKKLAKHFEGRGGKAKGMTVVFSTYQSIDVISKAQKLGLPEFDLIICDEAHRTTGVTLAGADESSFVKVHDNEFIQAKKRMYMTATPRIYGDQSKAKAAEVGAELTSMDNPAYFGEEFHRLNFGKAVSAGLLSDYKVLVLAVSEEHVSRQLQRLLTRDGELDLDDATKIVGCYNGLRKRSNNSDDFIVDTQPMKSAVAFSRSIKDSKRLAELFQVVTEELNKENKEKGAIKAEADHVDGTYNMEARLTKLDWLKEETENTVRILSNARCLSEGVDVPALDAVLFLNPRDSQVDVVQSVGRVMRRSPGKEYGYVILPITVPLGKTAEEALEDNNRYKVVWQVLQALRSHDERFSAMINKIDLTGDTDDRFKVIGVGGANDEEGLEGTNGKQKDTSFTLDFPIEDWKDAILAKIVQKVGQRTYWENWAADVAELAKNHISRIGHLVVNGEDLLKDEFSQFLRGLQDNLNPSITSDDAIEMLAQHLITKPVFDALFEGYAFTERNPVSIAMQRMIIALEGASINKESAELEGFYESVRLRAAGIADGAAKQKIIKELYEKFFRIAFAGTSDKLGIVYTPNEIVDFILHSTEAVLKRHFGRSISDERVHVLDPFTGTGTFIVRLLQSGLIRNNDLARKYKNELHANEIVLLAYYVAAVNIEQEFHALSGASHTPFDGIVLTDTFQMFERDDQNEIPGSEVFPENNERVLHQKNAPITVVIGNPPYSVGQSEANENNQNAKYATLDKKISDTYAELSTATLKYRLYDSYVRAIRWATDRIGDEGVVSFVINNGILDKNTFDGFRKTVGSEFSDIYIVNLRGNSKVGGATANAEGGNVFDIRIGVTVITFVKDGKYGGPARIRYWETPDASTKAQKFDYLKSAINHENLPMVELQPNESGDWINQRDPDFDQHPVLGSKNKGTMGSTRVFETFSLGIASGRDAWVYNFDSKQVEKNVSRMVAFYSAELERFTEAKAGGSNADPSDFVSMDSTKISWGADALRDVGRGVQYTYKPSAIRVASYRPFCDMPLYLDPQLIGRTGQTGQYFPEGERGNVAIAVLGSPFGALVVNKPTDLNFFGLGGQVFPKYTYSLGQPADTNELFTDFDTAARRSNVTEKFLSDCASVIGRDVSVDEAFDYVYGLLQSDGYNQKYSANLAKAMPRIPISKDFETFRAIGHRLIDLHLSLESQAAFPADIVHNDHANRSIKKMRIVKHESSLTIVVNESLSISGIPVEVLNWKLGVKSALEWYVDRFSQRQDASSGIVNDPNSANGGSDVVIENLLKLVSLSLETLRLKSELPAI